MSKSLGNSIFAADLLAAAEPAVVRYYLGSAHYRSVLDYHEGVLDEAATAFGRIQNFLARANRSGTAETFDGSTLEALPAAFIAAMDDDLAIPVALGVLHDTVREGNAALDAGDAAAVRKAVIGVQAMLEVLGLESDSENSAGSAHTQALGSLIHELIAERNAARAAKDFARSDAIRDQLKAAGIAIEDAADGTHWSVS
jgi:cysteinyl-tRNA synthetase